MKKKNMHGKTEPEKVNLDKGSYNRGFIALGALASNGGSLGRQELAECIGLPVSTLADLMKKFMVGHIHGLEVTLEGGVYNVESWSFLVPQKELKKMYENDWVAK